MKNWIACLSLGVAVGCGGPSASERPARLAEPPDSQAADASANDGRLLTSSERARVEVLVRSAERIRGLAFRTPVEMRVQTAQQVRVHLAEELDENDLVQGAHVYESIGLLPPGTNIREIFLDVIEEQVVGYYDSKTRRLVLREDVFEGAPSTREESFGESSMVILHELVHALQDQHFGGLDAAFEARERSDEENAYHAVVEGDATLAMLGEIASRSGAPFRAIASRLSQMNPQDGALLASTSPGNEQLRSVPAIVRVCLAAAYLDGAIFASKRLLRGGWPAVDAAHATPPSTTEQVLHEEKYESHESPDAIVIPSFSTPGLRDAELIADDTLGELEMSVYFARGTGNDRDRPAAEGWSGDRLRVFRSNDALSAIWFSAWDTERDATEAEETAKRVGPEVFVTRVGRAVLFVHSSPTPSALDEVRIAFESFAASLARRTAP
jgi:hypothetical protein